MNVNPYLKAIVGAVVSGLGAAEVAVQASPHHSIDLGSGISIAITTLVGLGAVYASGPPVVRDLPVAVPTVALPLAHAEPIAAALDLPPLPPAPPMPDTLPPHPHA